jgi:NAD(P)-dependent dehydrogenase (short-subunit alcohol dehydrogenase family)
VTVAGLLDGKVAAVTGGARGLGAAICAEFAAAGAIAVALDIAGAEPCDVTEKASIAGALTRVVAWQIVAVEGGLV